MHVHLVMFKSDGAARRFPIAKRSVILGRDVRSDLRIPLGTVSRRHCEISIRGDEVWVRDLGSRNGTFVNDVRVREAPLDDGDRLAIGPVLFTIAISALPEAAAVPELTRAALPETMAMHAAIVG